MWVFIKRSNAKFDVGFYSADGNNGSTRFNLQASASSENEAMRIVSYLNGGSGDPFVPVEVLNERRKNASS